MRRLLLPTNRAGRSLGFLQMHARMVRSRGYETPASMTEASKKQSKTLVKIQRDLPEEACASNEAGKSEARRIPPNNQVPRPIQVTCRTDMVLAGTGLPRPLAHRPRGGSASLVAGTRTVGTLPACNYLLSLRALPERPLPLTWLVPRTAPDRGIEDSYWGSG